MSNAGVGAKRWTREEYDRLIEVGFFQPGDRIELLGGGLIVAEPQGAGHYTAICAVEHALRAAFGSGWAVRVQGPVLLDDESEPEPDVAIVPGTFRDYRDAHPARPVLVVEVAESSLAMDRGHKGSLYARAGLPDYWIVNLASRMLEIYREPGPDARAPFGWSYQSVVVAGPDQRISPLALAGVTIAVAALLP